MRCWTLPIATVAMAALFAALHVGAADYEEERDAAPTGCAADEHCPEYAGNVAYTLWEELLPPFDVLLRKNELTAPYTSPVFPIATADGETAQYFQLRTLQVVTPDQLASTRGKLDRRRRRNKRAQEKAESGESAVSAASEKEKARIAKFRPRYFLALFALSTGHPYIHISEALDLILREAGAVEGAAQTSTCLVQAPLTVRTARCVRVFTPSRIAPPVVDIRKNIIGGLDAALAIQLQAAFDVARALDPAAWAPVNVTEDAIAAFVDQVMASNAFSVWPSRAKPRDMASYEAIQGTLARTKREREEVMRQRLLSEVRALAQHDVHWSYPPPASTLPLKPRTAEDDAADERRREIERKGGKRAAGGAFVRDGPAPSAFDPAVDEPDHYDDL